MNFSPSSQSGFLSFGLLRLILPLVLLWAAGQGLYTALTNRHPVSMTFAEYERQRPDAKWVELKSTQLDMTGVMSSGFVGSVSEVYIPLRAGGSRSDAKVFALLLTRDQGTLDLVREMKMITDEKAALAFMLKNHERLRPVRDVSGLLQFGIDSESKKRRKIAKLNPDLAADFIVIEEGKRPGILASMSLLGASFVAAWLCWFCRFGKRAEVAVPPPMPLPLPPPLPR